MGNTVTLKILIDSSGIAPGLSKVRSEISSLSSAGVSEIRKLNSSMESGKSSAQSWAITMKDVRNTLATLGIAHVASEILSAGIAMDRFETSLTAASGSRRQASIDFQFLRGEAERLGLYLPTLIQGFTQLTAATRNTSLEGKTTRDIFIAVAEAGRAMNLSNDAIAGTLTAIQQIVSKGTVSMEELKQQLGDRLPGALQIAARAMDMTTSELIKLVSTGGLASDVFLPKFAEELRKANAASIEFASSRPSAEFERLRTAIFELMTSISDDSLEVLSDAAQELSTTISSLIQSGAISTLGSLLATILSYSDDLAISIAVLYGVKGLGGLKTAWDNQIKTLAATSAAYELMGLRVNTLSTIKKQLLSSGKQLFSAMGGWTTVIAATAAGFYALIEAGEASQAEMLKFTTALSEQNTKMEEQIRLKALLDQGRISSSDQYSSALGDQLSDLDKLNSDYLEYIRVLENAKAAEDGVVLAREDLAYAAELISKANEQVSRHFSNIIQLGGQIPPMYRETAEAAEEYGQIVAKFAGVFFSSSTAAELAAESGAQLVESQLSQIATTQNLSEEEVKLLDSLEDKTAVLGKTTAQTLAYEKAQAMAKATTEQARLEIEKSYDALIAKTIAVEANEKALDLRNKALDEAVRLMHQEEDAYDRMRMRQEESAQDLRAYLEDLQFESTLIGKTADEIERSVAIRQAENLVKEAGSALSAKEAQNLLNLINVQVQVNQQKYRMAELAEEYRDRWISAIEDVSNSFGDFIVGNIKSFKDFGQELIKTAKNFVAKIISEFAKIQIAKMLANSGGSLGQAAQSLLTQYGMSSSSVGGSTASGLGMFEGVNLLNVGKGIWSGFSSALYGSGQSTILGNMLGTSMYGPGMTTAWAPTALGSAGLAAGGLTGAYYGYQRSGNIAGAVGYGALGLGATGAAMGVASGAGAMAGATGAFASLGAGAAIPVIGWIAAIAALVDTVSGGKLFGTKYRPESVTSTLALGEDGGTASASMTEVRQRSLFRGRSWRTTGIDAGDEATQAADELYANIYGLMVRSANQLAIDVPPVIDAALRTVTEYDKKGKVKATKIFVDILGRSWEEATAELASTRLSAEAIIATVDAALAQVVYNGLQKGAALQLDGGSGGDIGESVSTASAIMGEASQIAERWRDDAEQLMIGAQYLLAAATDMRNGNALLGESVSLTVVTDFVEEMSQGAETILETYTRLSASASMLDQALNLSGAALDLTREEFVRFAADITDAAGGLDRANTLWNDYFSRFYSPEELLANQAVGVNAAAQSEFSDIGLNLEDYSGDGGMAAFRTLFEEQLPTLSADAIVEWLEAASALGVVIDLQSQQNAILAEQAAALEEYNSYVRSLQDELDEAGMSEFAIEMRDINRWAIENTDALNVAARAAGLQAAREEDLGLVHQVAAQRAAAAIERLRTSAASLVNQLYGSELDSIEDQIRTLEQSQTSSIQNVGEAAADMYAQQLQAIQGIKAWLDGELLGELSTLTPEQKLAEATRQFQEMLQLARGGDLDALQSITGQANTLLQLGQGYWASGQQYTDLEAMVRAGLSGLTGLNPQGGNSTGGQNFANQSQGVSAELQELYEARDAAILEAEQAQRQALLAELGGMIRELIQATGQPLAEVASSIGLNLSALAEDLGINLNELSANTASSLVDMARSLGVDVAELATNVGVSLGNLGDRQSLLNQALDATLVDIPEEFRNQLASPLEAIRSATTEADATEAVNAAEAAINNMPQGIRDLLAPYFENVFPVSAVTELTQLSSIAKIAADQLVALQYIASKIAPDETSGVKSYAVGTSYVPQDMLANIHQGEMILPASVSAFARSAGIKISPANLDSQVIEELRLTREAQAAASARLEARISSLEAAQRQSSGEISRSVRQLSDTLMIRGR